MRFSLTACVAGKQEAIGEMVCRGDMPGIGYRIRLHIKERDREQERVLLVQGGDAAP
jgi:hypothetical protein